MQLHVQTLIIANTGLVPCQFEFITKLNEPSYCKPWFSATPNKGILIEGMFYFVPKYKCVSF